MKGWRFGVGQTAKEERAEMADARRAGLERDYVRQQRWARMREDELERRRARKRERRERSRR
jgi:hypothetical protein